MKARLIPAGLTMAAAFIASPWVCAEAKDYSAGTAKTGEVSTSNVKLSKSEIREVQQALHNEGHYTGPIDGVMGPRTRQAVEKFQTAHNMESSGRIDQNTLAALNIKTSDSMGASGARSEGTPGHEGKTDKSPHVPQTLPHPTPAVPHAPNPNPIPTP